MTASRSRRLVTGLRLSVVVAMFLGVVLAVWWSCTHRDVIVELHVTDARGQPVETFGWSGMAEVANAARIPFQSAARFESGIALVKLPRTTIHLEIDAPGYGRASLDSLRPSDHPRLDVVVPDLGLVRGVVTHAGRPVAGASVELLAESTDVVEGIRSGSFYGWNDPPSRTDASGSFAIGSDFPGMPYFVRACQSGFAPSIAGPVRVGDPPIDIELTLGGTVEGRLHGRDTSPAFSRSIRLYRDWMGGSTSCAEQTVAVDAHGGFRLEHVAPGAWLARVWNPVDDAGEPQPLPQDDLPFVLFVRAGETTHVDMDLARPIATLHGTASLNGKPWTGAFAQLHTIGEHALLLDVAHPDSRGGWTLRSREPGRYRLVVHGNHQHALEPGTVTDVVDTATEGATWSNAFTWARSDPDVIVLHE